MYSDPRNKGQDVGVSFPIGLDLPAAHALDERQIQLVIRLSCHSAWHGASVTAPTCVVTWGPLLRRAWSWFHALLSLS